MASVALTRHSHIPVSEGDGISTGPPECPLFFHIWKTNPEVFFWFESSYGGEKSLFISVKSKHQSVVSHFIRIRSFLQTVHGSKSGKVNLSIHMKLSKADYLTSIVLIIIQNNFSFAFCWCKLCLEFRMILFTFYTGAMNTSQTILNVYIFLILYK